MKDITLRIITVLSVLGYLAATIIGVIILFGVGFWDGIAVIVGGIIVVDIFNLSLYYIISGEVNLDKTIFLNSLIRFIFAPWLTPGK